MTNALMDWSCRIFAVHVAIAQSSCGGAALTAAWVNLWLGASVTIVIVAAGFQAFLSVRETAIVDHRNWAIATAIIWWIAALWAAWSARRSGP
jgi:hypothetical protein